MGQRLLVLNTALTIILLLIVIFVIFYFTYTLQKAKRYISSFSKSFLPKLSKVQYKSITFPEKSPNFLSTIIKAPLAVSNIFESSIHSSFVQYSLTFFTACCMSSYNLTAGVDGLLPNYMRLYGRVGPCGYLFQCGKHAILCFRGSINGRDIFTDIDSVQVSFSDLSGQSHEQYRVHRGFHSIWMNTISDVEHILDTIKAKNIILVGHSLGGAIAHLAGLGIFLYTGIKPLVVTFGSPKIGSDSLVKVSNSMNIANVNDFIPCLPPSVFTIDGERCLYAAYPNTKYIDVQTGSTFKNHSLITYSYGVNQKFISDKQTEIMWCKPF